MPKRVFVGCGGFDYAKALKGLLTEQPRRPHSPFGLYDWSIMEMSHGLRTPAWTHLQASAGGYR